MKIAHTIYPVGTLAGYKFVNEEVDVISYDDVEYSVDKSMEHYFYELFWAREPHPFANGIYGLKVGGPIKVVKDDSYLSE